MCYRSPQSNNSNRHLEAFCAFNTNLARPIFNFVIIIHEMKTGPVNSLGKTPLHMFKAGGRLRQHNYKQHCALLETQGLTVSPEKLQAQNKRTGFEDIGSGMIPGDQESSRSHKLSSAAMDGLKDKRHKAQGSQTNGSCWLHLWESRVHGSSVGFYAPTDKEESDRQQKLKMDVSDTPVGYADSLDNFQEEEEEEEEEDGLMEGGLPGEQCKGLCKMSMKTKRMVGFMGKHTRFFYDSDDEIKEEEDNEFDSYRGCQSNEDNGNDWDDNGDDDDDTWEEGGLVWEPYKGFSMVSVPRKMMPQFMGQHSRFVYNSNDEVEEEDATGSSPVLPDFFGI